MQETRLRMSLRFAVLICAVLSMAAEAQTVPTNTLQLYKASYDAAAARITAGVQRQKEEALSQYGRSLAALLQSVKSKGDFDAYVSVEAEAKRFAADKTFPTNAVQSDIVKAAAAYQKEFADADLDATRRQAALLKQYVSTLNGLVKALMARDRIDDAKAARDAQKAAEAMLAEMEASLPSLGEPAVKAEQPQVAEGGAGRKGALSQKFRVCVTNYQDVTRSDDTPAMDISVTSENPLAHDKRSICDGRRETGFAFVGPKGRITLSFPTDVKAKKIIMIGRIDTALDVIAKGRVKLNNTAQFEIKGFGNKNMIVIDNPQKQAIRTISVESIEGVNNPGINEIYFVK